MAEMLNPLNLKGAVDALDRFALRRGAFTLEEFLKEFPDRSPETARAQLTYAVKRGRLFRVKPNLYQDTDAWDPVALAARWAPDAVIAYETAFRLHFDRTGLLSSAARFLTATRCRPMLDPHGTLLVDPAHPPPALGDSWMWFGISNVDGIRVTSPWRTLVDVLDRIDLAPSVHAIWPAFLTANPDPLEMIDYACRLPNRLAGARLGFFLDRLPGIPAHELERLPRAKFPTCFDRARHPNGNMHHPRRNLLVPMRVLLQVARTDFRYATPRLPDDDMLPPM